MLQIVTNYTPRSHVLCGAALKDVYEPFRLQVLRVEEWATWHPKLVPIPGGKGWCIRKASLDDLVAKLNEYKIPFETVEYSGPSRVTKKKQKRDRDRDAVYHKQKKQAKGYKNAYSFFAKDKWKEAQSRLPAEMRKDISKVSKEVAKMWKEVEAISKDTQWHVKAKEARDVFERANNPILVPSLQLPPRLPLKVEEPSTQPSAIYHNLQPTLLSLSPPLVVEKTYKELWRLVPHESEIFSFGNVDETTGEEYRLCRFIYKRKIRGSEGEYEHATLSFRLPLESTEEEMYKRAWELDKAVV